MPFAKKISVNNFLLIIVGLMFFLNPMIILFDFIPDFIGCILIMLGLHRLSALTSDFDDAFSYFKYMLIASVFRLCIAMVSGQFDNVMYLCISMILGIVEAIIAYLGLTALCDGVNTLKYRFSSNELEPMELRNIGVAFFVARGLCSMLPYVTSVLDREDDLLLPGHVEDTGDYTILLLTVNVIITVIFAVFLAVTIIKHLGVYVKNKDLRTEIKAAINEKKANVPEFFVRKNLVFSLMLLAYSSVFLVDVIAGLSVGGRNFIPDFVFGIMTVWAVILLKKQLNGYLAPMISGIVYTVASTVNFFVYDDFLSRHYYTDFDMLIVHFPSEYIFAIVFSAVETVALIVFAVLLTRYLIPLATFFSVPDYTPEFVRLGIQIEQSRRLSKRLLIGFCVFLCFVALSGTALTVLLPLFDVGYDDIDFPYLLAHIVFHAIFYAYASSVFLRLKNGVLKRYDYVPTGK